MKKMILSLVLLAMCFSQESHAILDLIKSFSKRNKVIEKTFLQELNTDSKAWLLAQIPLENNGSTAFFFIPSIYDAKNWLEKFTYTEMKESKKKLSLDQVWEVMKLNNPIPKDGEANVLFRNEKEIHFELISPMNSRSGRTWQIIGRFVQTSPNQINLYDYEVRKRNLSQEEKQQWFEFFKKININF